MSAPTLSSNLNLLKSFGKTIGTLVTSLEARSSQLLGDIYVDWMLKKALVYFLPLVF